jgi:hypothetical protein
VEVKQQQSQHNERKKKHNSAEHDHTDQQDRPFYRKQNGDVSESISTFNAPDLITQHTPEQNDERTTQTSAHLASEDLLVDPHGVVVHEGRLPGHHFVQQDAQCPPVHALAVTLRYNGNDGNVK